MNFSTEVMSPFIVESTIVFARETIATLSEASSAKTHAWKRRKATARQENFTADLLPSGENDGKRRSAEQIALPPPPHGTNTLALCTRIGTRKSPKTPITKNL